MFIIRGELTGLRDALNSLKAVKRSAGSRILRKALSAASKPMLDTARQLVPRRTGLLRKSLGRRIKTYRSTGIVVVMIGPRTGFKRQIKGGRAARRADVRGKQAYADPTHYAHLVERGTVRSRATPYLRPAFDQHKTAAEATVARIVREELDKALRGSK